MCWISFGKQRDLDVHERNQALKGLQQITKQAVSSSRLSQVSFSSTPTESQGGELEETIWKVHQAILTLMDNQCRLNHKKAGEDGASVLEVRKEIREALILKANMMKQAALIFNIPSHDISAHWEAAKHYGFQKTQESNEALQTFLLEKQAASLPKLELSRPTLLEVPQTDSDTKPGVPNYLVWVDSLQERKSPCGCEYKIDKLKKMADVQIFEVGNQPDHFNLSESPKVGVLYVRHPNRPLYIPSKQYDDYLSKESAREFVYFLSLLGATKVVFEKGSECSLGKELSAAIDEGHVTVSGKNTATQSSTQSTHYEVDLLKKGKGYVIPEDKIKSLFPFQRDPTWQSLMNLRKESSTNVLFTLKQDTSGLNETTTALKIMKMGFDGTYKKTSSRSNSVDCKITFTPMKEYASYRTVSLDEEGYGKILDLEDKEEVRQFAIRYASENGLNVPPQNLPRIEKVLKEKTPRFRELLYLIYINITPGPDGFMQVLEYQKNPVLNQFLVYALPENAQKIDNQQLPIVSSIVSKLLELYRFVIHNHQAAYANKQSAFKMRMYQIFLNLKDDLEAKKIAFSRKEGEVLDLSLSPTQDTQWLMNGESNWGHFFERLIDEKK